MRNARELARVHPRLLPLVRFVLGEGWTVTRTKARGIELLKTGLPPIYMFPAPAGPLAKPPRKPDRIKDKGGANGRELNHD